MENSCMRKIFACICILLTACVIAPLLYYSRYNFLSSDDYSIGVEAHLAWVGREGFLSGIFAVFSNAINTMRDMYMNWGGNYTSMIFTSLQPAVFNENFAVVNTYILLGSFILANIYFFWKFYKNFKLSKVTTVILICGVLILSTQWLPSALEGFYWFNGSFYNIVGYSVGLIFGINMYEVANNANKSVFFCILTSLTGIFVAGTSYTMILFYLLAGVIFLVYMLAVKCPARNRRRYILIFVTFTIFSLINILAPGNSVRQGSFLPMNPVLAIYNALMEGRKYFLGLCNVRLILFAIVLFPFLFCDLSNLKCKFSCPFGFTIVVYILYSAMFTPTLYSIHTLGPVRTQNLYYWTGILVHLLNYIYWVGWLKNKLKSHSAVLKIQNHGKAILYHICICILFVFVYFHKIDISNTTAFTAMSSILSGEAETWRTEMKDRQEVLLSADQEEVELPAASVQPVLVYIHDITENADDWFSIAVARWYGLKSVSLKPQE